MYYVLYAMYYVLCTMYYVLYTIYYILYTIYYILHTIYYIIYTIYYILYTIYYVIYTIYYILYTTYYILYTVYYGQLWLETAVLTRPGARAPPQSWPFVKQIRGTLKYPGPRDTWPKYENTSRSYALFVQAALTIVCSIL